MKDRYRTYKIKYKGCIVEISYDSHDNKASFRCGDWQCEEPWSLIKDRQATYVELFWGSAYYSGCSKETLNAEELSEAIAVLSVARKWLLGRRPRNVWLKYKGGQAL